MKRCLIYARCSTDDQDNANQVAQLTDYARRQEWTLIEVVQDVCSGGRAANDREGLKKVFLMAHQKKFDILLFWSLDRLSREGSRITIQYLTTLEGHGIDWHSFTEPYLSSLGVFKDAIIAILGALARQEKIKIGERTKAGLERTRRVNGTRLGRPKTDGKRIQQAIGLKSQGLSFAEIGKSMGITRGRAHQLVHTSL